MTDGHRRGLLAVLVAGGAAGVAAWAVLFSSLLGAASVVVSGNDRLTAQEIRRVAAIRDGQPLATLDVAGIRAKIAALPRVEWAQVDRNWPRTVRIRVHERTPIAVAQVGGRTALVDRYGAIVEFRDPAPAGLPRLRVAHLAVDDPVARAALAVIRGLPIVLSGRVAEVHADTPTSVTLSLTDGRTVLWGGPERTARKARILRALLMQRRGDRYDVSSPDVATVN